MHMSIPRYGQGIESKRTSLVQGARPPSFASKVYCDDVINRITKRLESVPNALLMSANVSEC